MARKGQSRIARGSGWPMAWHFLSEEQKEALTRGRVAGRFGGDARGRPLYWAIQEYGMPEVGITPKGYIARSLDRIKERITAMVERFLGW